nr:MAG TPA: hypothetical protein [Caudoviricetes sp.]
MRVMVNDILDERVTRATRAFATNGLSAARSKVQFTRPIC